MFEAGDEGEGDGVKERQKGGTSNTFIGEHLHRRQAGDNGEGDGVQEQQQGARKIHSSEGTSNVVRPAMNAREMIYKSSRATSSVVRPAMKTRGVV